MSDGPDPLWELDVMMRRAGLSTEPPTTEPPAPPDPAEVAAARRRRRLRRIPLLVIVVLIVAAIATYVPLSLNAPLHSAALAAHRPSLTQPAAITLALAPQAQSAVSVAGADEFLGAGASGILASAGGDAPHSIASISKLITAMVVLDAKPLAVGTTGPTLSFDKADADLYDKYYVLGATVASMRKGTSMNEHDAIETMLVASACNYSEAVSTWAFGSQARFLAATRAWLTKHGFTATTMVEPTGIDPRNTSTPSDLIGIGKLAMANPVIASIVAMPATSIADHDPISGTNDLLGVDGVNGIKTGTLDGSGSDLLFSASVDVGIGTPLTVVGVVLGGTSRFEVDADVKALIASIRSGFHAVKLVSKGQVIGTYATPWKDDGTIVAGADASILTWSNTPIHTDMTTTSITTASNGTTVGRLSWKAGTKTASVPLVLQGSITPPTAWWRLTHPSEVFSH